MRVRNFESRKATKKYASNPERTGVPTGKFPVIIKTRNMTCGEIEDFQYDSGFLLFKLSGTWNNRLSRELKIFWLSTLQYCRKGIDWIIISLFSSIYPYTYFAALFLRYFNKSQVFTRKNLLQVIIQFSNQSVSKTIVLISGPDCRIFFLYQIR